jgi:hypothetical protein
MNYLRNVIDKAWIIIIGCLNREMCIYVYNSEFVCIHRPCMYIINVYIFHKINIRLEREDCLGFEVIYLITQIINLKNN